VTITRRTIARARLSKRSPAGNWKLRMPILIQMFLGAAPLL
jgi:hypothetical protein